MIFLAISCPKYTRFESDIERCTGNFNDTQFVYYTLNYNVGNAQSDGRPAEYRWRPLRKFRNSITCTTPQSLANTRCWTAVQDVDIK